MKKPVYTCSKCGGPGISRDPLLGKRIPKIMRCPKCGKDFCFMCGLAHVTQCSPESQAAKQITELLGEKK